MEVVPGIKANPTRTDAEEVAELRAKIAADQITQDEEKKRRIDAIIADVKKRIADEDGPIRVTPEMEELGIAKQVWDMVQDACRALPFKRLLGMGDDDDDLDPGDSRSWID